MRRFVELAEGVVGSVLERKHWHVMKEPDCRHLSQKPDLLAKSPLGIYYMFEITGGRTPGTATFTDLAQTKAFARAVTEEMKVGQVVPVLVTNYSISDELSSLSRSLGVRLIGVNDKAHDRWQSFLERWADEPDTEIAIQTDLAG